MRLFLRAHGARLALVWIEQPRLLIDRAAIFEDRDLATRFRLDGLADEADRVDVLDLAARAEIATRPAHRHVHVGPHGAFSMLPSQVPR
jgi:hypothetical protein